MTGVTLVATMTKLLVAKLLCMVGMFFFMLLGSLLPVKVIEADFEKAHRSKKVLSLCNTFGGGVFLATCFNALLPAVRDKVRLCWRVGRRAGEGSPLGTCEGLLHRRAWATASPSATWRLSPAALGRLFQGHGELRKTWAWFPTHGSFCEFPARQGQLLPSEPQAMVATFFVSESVTAVTRPCSAAPTSAH